MSYWVYLEQDDGRTVEVERFQDGGTQPVGGTTQAELNVTYNYGVIFRKMFGWSIRDLHGCKAEEAIAKLEEMTVKLPNAPDDDYWAPTEGNAGAVVHRLLTWARQHPHAAWRVS